MESILEIEVTREVLRKKVVKASVRQRAGVDLSGVDFIASTGMRLLLSNTKAMANQGGHMAICQAQALVKKALQMAGIDSLIPVYDSEADVISAFLA